MWMTQYLEEIKRQFVEVYKLNLESVPDGQYPMTINGKVDNVQVINGKLHCCNFKAENNERTHDPLQSTAGEVS